MREKTKKVNLLKSVDAERIAIKRDHYFPEAYVIDLPLDSTPDHVWQDIFEQEWRLSRRLWERKLFVVGNQLRLITTMHEIEDKLDWVKQIVEKTNKHVDEYNREAEARSAQMEEQMKRRTLEEEARIREIVKKFRAV